MKLTTRGRYALQALLDMINNDTGKATKLLDISTRQNLPIAYLEQLFRQLRIGGVVKAVRGPGGGYVLARPASEIRIGEVFKAVKELTSYSDVIQLSEAPSKEQLCAHKAVTRLDEAALKVINQPITSLL